ncbi:uncharacterized protein TNCV_878561 [Trichonephila clavipes]|nr:uncharacterized protein TNCV_878561 [Trichonephila clavipes]
MTPVDPVWKFADGGASTATREFLATDLVILNHGQVTKTTPELAPPLLTATPHQREDIYRFNVHRSPTRRVFSGTELELMTHQPRSDALTTRLPWPPDTARHVETMVTEWSRSRVGADVVESQLQNLVPKTRREEWLTHIKFSLDRSHRSGGVEVRLPRFT